METQHKLEPGMVVRLRSGGPLMTVTGLHGDKNAELALATTDGNISVLILPAVALEPLDWAHAAGRRVLVEGTVVHGAGNSPDHTYVDFVSAGIWVPTTAVRPV
jgi:hypothetical protein